MIINNIASLVAEIIYIYIYIYIYLFIYFMTVVIIVRLLLYVRIILNIIVVSVILAAGLEGSDSEAAFFCDILEPRYRGLNILNGHWGVYIIVYFEQLEYGSCGTLWYNSSSWNCVSAAML